MVCRITGKVIMQCTPWTKTKFSRWTITFWSSKFPAKGSQRSRIQQSLSLH